MFPQRDTAEYTSEPDSVLRNIVDSFKATPLRAKAELELETRAWLRDFWSRSIVAWFALILSIISLVIAICSFVRH
jgi:hypothetical protein